MTNPKSVIDLADPALARCIAIVGRAQMPVRHAMLNAMAFEPSLSPDEMVATSIILDAASIASMIRPNVENVEAVLDQVTTLIRGIVADPTFTLQKQATG
jgi:hypothetical protein